MIARGPSRCSQDEARELVRRFKSHDYYQQVGDTFHMRMSPSCANPQCDHGTKISKRCCGECTTSTEDRTKVAVLDQKTGKPKCIAEGKHVYHSEHASLSEAAVREGILRLCEPPLTPEQAAAFYVSIVEIFHGKAMQLLDPWGHMWAEHDPLARVGFFNPKQDKLEEKPRKPNNKVLTYLPSDSEGLQGVNQKEDKAYRTLSCFMKHKDTAAAEIIEVALNKWCKERAAPPQQGATNPMASPSTPRRQAARVGNATHPMQSFP